MSIEAPLQRRRAWVIWAILGLRSWGTHRSAALETCGNHCPSADFSRFSFPVLLVWMCESSAMPWSESLVLTLRLMPQGSRHAVTLRLLQSFLCPGAPWRLRPCFLEKWQEGGWEICPWQSGLATWPGLLNLHLGFALWYKTSTRG